MPKIYKQYNYKSNNIQELYRTFTSDTSQQVSNIHNRLVSWLESNPAHKNYNKYKTDNHTYGRIMVIDSLQQWFYESVKDIITSLSVSATHNDSEQSITIFGTKIFPVLWSIPGRLDLLTNESYNHCVVNFPVIFKENDYSLMYNSFIGRNVVNSNFYSNGYDYSSNSRYYFWLENKSYTDSSSESLKEQYGNLSPFIGGRSFSSKEQAVNALNNFTLRLTCHYNSDYIIMTYRGNNGCTTDIPLFSLLKGTIQNNKKTPIVWCCGCPNDYCNIDNQDYYQRKAFNGSEFNNNGYRNFHHMFIPSNPDIILEREQIPEMNKIGTSFIKYGNQMPFWLDWRENNGWLKGLLEEDSDDTTYVFRKQNLTAFSGFIQFSDNIIYADENCINGQYYEIDGEKYWCPSNYLLDKRINNHQKYSENFTRILVKL